jgi:hypothetical protein
MRAFPGGVRYLALSVIGLAVTGCGQSNVVAVSGTLTYKGQPVTNAIVHFVPETGRPSMGETDPQGNFVLTYDPQTKGAQRGKHRVFVQHNAAADQSRPGTIPGMPVVLPADLKELFNKYGGANSKVEVVIDKSIRDLRLDWD